MQGGAAGAVESANMLWLIQRDFLEGKTVAAMLAEALAVVPNPTRDPDIDQVTGIVMSAAPVACGLVYSGVLLTVHVIVCCLATD